MAMPLSLYPNYLPIAYLAVHSLLVWRAPVTKMRMRILFTNALLACFFLLQINLDFSSAGPWVLLVLGWSPIVFFWWAYLWAHHTLRAVFPTNFFFDEGLIQLEHHIGQPALWWARTGSRALTELFHLGYFSYYFYTPAMAGYLFSEQRWQEFEAASFSVLFGYLIAYPIFALYPVAGPRWSLCEKGLLSPREQKLEGYVVTALTNRIMYQGLAHKGGAMPSSHSSTALVFLIWSWRIWDWPVAMLCTVFVVSMWLGSIYGRYHFVTDVLVGALLGLVSVFLADYLILNGLPG
jgi:membrane-associated phospholipid phosphatase